MRALSGRCESCTGGGDVLYVVLEGIPPGPISGWHVRSDGATRTAVKCRRCALALLVPSLPGRFDAVALPRDGSGVVAERSMAEASY